MLDAVDLLGESLSDFYHHVYLMFVSSLLWLALCLPLVTLPPAAGGLYYVANQAIRGKRVDWRDFFVGLRRYFWSSWRIALLCALVVGVSLFNIQFYSHAGGAVGVLLGGAFVAAIILWLPIQFYLFPFVLEQEKDSLRLALRNSVVLLAFNLRYSFTLTLILAVATLLASIYALPLVWLMPALAALAGNRAVLERTKRISREQD